MSPGIADGAAEEVSHENENETAANDAEPGQCGKDSQRMFVPVKRCKSAKLTKFEETVKKTLEKATESLEKDNMKDLLFFFERRTELARQHEINLFSMFGQSIQMTPQWQSPSTVCNGAASMQFGNQSFVSGMLGFVIVVTLVTILRQLWFK